MVWADALGLANIDVSAEKSGPSKDVLDAGQSPGSDYLPGTYELL